MGSRLSRASAAANRAAGGLWLDLALYALSTVFAAVTASTSTLLPHRAWGGIAAIGYAAATVVTAVQLLGRRFPHLAGTPARTALTSVVWAATGLLPLVTEAVQLAAGRTDQVHD